MKFLRYWRAQRSTTQPACLEGNRRIRRPGRRRLCHDREECVVEGRRTAEGRELGDNFTSKSRTRTLRYAPMAIDAIGFTSRRRPNASRCSSETAFRHRKINPRLNQNNLARGQIVVCANHAELAGGDHLSENRLLGLQALHVGLHVGHNGSLI